MHELVNEGCKDQKSETQAKASVDNLRIRRHILPDAGTTASLRRNGTRSEIANRRTHKPCTHRHTGFLRRC